MQGATLPFPNVSSSHCLRLRLLAADPVTFLFEVDRRSPDLRVVTNFTPPDLSYPHIDHPPVRPFGMRTPDSCAPPMSQSRKRPDPFPVVIHRTRQNQILKNESRRVVALPVLTVRATIPATQIVIVSALPFHALFHSLSSTPPGIVNHCPHISRPICAQCSAIASPSSVAGNMHTKASWICSMSPACGSMSRV